MINTTHPSKMQKTFSSCCTVLSSLACLPRPATTSDFSDNLRGRKLRYHTVAFKSLAASSNGASESDCYTLRVRPVTNGCCSCFHLIIELYCCKVDGSKCIVIPVENKLFFLERYWEDFGGIKMNRDVRCKQMVESILKKNKTKNMEYFVAFHHVTQIPPCVCVGVCVWL